MSTSPELGEPRHGLPVNLRGRGEIAVPEFLRNPVQMPANEADLFRVLRIPGDDLLYAAITRLGENVFRRLQREGHDFRPAHRHLGLAGTLAGGCSRWSADRACAAARG